MTGAPDPENCQHPTTRLVLVDGLPSGAAFCPDCGAQMTAPCPHPAARLYAWWARDDTAPGGRVLCVGCCKCGQVLLGGAELPEAVRDEEPIYF